MAREMALAGVPKEELLPDNHPEEPQTPKDKWKNFWYYYKWWILFFVALALIIFIGVYQMVTTVKPDYVLSLVTKNVIPSESIDGMEAEFAKYGEDLNGDGKVVVEVEPLPLSQYAGGSKNAAAENNTQKLMAYLVSADVMFYIFDDDVYTDYLKELMETSKDGLFFEKTAIQHEGISETENYWNWSKSPYAISFWGVDMPNDLYFGVRRMGGTASGDKVQKNHDDCLKLLEAIITEKTIEK